MSLFPLLQHYIYPYSFHIEEEAYRFNNAFKIHLKYIQTQYKYTQIHSLAHQDQK